MFWNVWGHLNFFTVNTRGSTAVSLATCFSVLARNENKSKLWISQGHWPCFCQWCSTSAKMLEVLVMTLKALHLGLCVSWIQIKLNPFEGCWWNNCMSMHVTKMYQGRRHKSEKCQEVLAHRTVDLHFIWCRRYLLMTTKIQVFSLVVLPVLVYGFKTDNV